jgi:hypothetical protein
VHLLAFLFRQCEPRQLLETFQQRFGDTVPAIDGDLAHASVGSYHGNIKIDFVRLGLPPIDDHPEEADLPGAADELFEGLDVEGANRSRTIFDDLFSAIDTPLIEGVNELLHLEVPDERRG